MRTLVGRMAGAMSDLTIGTVIVLVHVALADRAASRARFDADHGRLPRHGDALLEKHVHELS